VVRLSFDLDVDICSSARRDSYRAATWGTLKRAKRAPSVAVLDGRHVGWNASVSVGTVILARAVGFRSES